MAGDSIITEPLGLKSDLSTFSRDSLSACISFIVVSAIRLQAFYRLPIE